MIETEEPMLTKLEENQQLDLLFDMELPLANVLAKMEIAGIKVEAETLKAMQSENEVLIDQLTKEIYELAGQNLISIRLSSLGPFSLKRWDYRWNIPRKPRQAIQQQ